MAAGHRCGMGCGPRDQEKARGHVFAASPKYEVLATNRLEGEQNNSSIAVSNGELFIRTHKTLWCISDKK